MNRVLVIAGFADSLLNFRGELIREFGRRGCEVHLAAPGLTDSDGFVAALGLADVKLHNIRLNRAGVNPFLDFFSFLDILWLVYRVKPSLVFSYTVKPVIYGAFASALARVPKVCVLISGLGYAFQGDEVSGWKRRSLRKLVTALYRLALRRVAVVFFQNPDDASLFQRERIVNESTKLVVVNGSGVDLSRFAVVPLPSVSRFLLIGRLLGEKGVREYVEAARLVRASYPHVSFSLVGWIDENPDSIGAAELEGWERDGVVQYLGRLGDVREAISQCSVYVLPSYREGTPRTVLEAMSMGRAVITTDAPGCRETVVDGENGFLVSVKSVEELASAMLKLINCPGLQSRMGARSREIAEERYDVHLVNQVMLREMGL